MKSIKNLHITLTGLLLFLLLMVPETPLKAQEQGKLGTLVTRAEQTYIGQNMMNQFISRARKHKVKDGQIAELLQPAVELAEEGLPANIVIQKAFEGMAKGVSPQKIKPVLEKLKSNVVRAEDIVDPWLEKQSQQKDKKIITRNGNQKTVKLVMLESTAQSLSEGATEENVKRLLSSIDKSIKDQQLNIASTSAAIRVLPNLVTTEQNVDISMTLLVKALNSDFSASDLHQLPAAMKAAQRDSRLPAEAIANGFTHQLNEGVAAGRIIQNLYKGNIKGGPPGGTPPGLRNNPKGPDRGNAADQDKNGGKNNNSGKGGGQGQGNGSGNGSRGGG